MNMKTITLASLSLYLGLTITPLTADTLTIDGNLSIVGDVNSPFVKSLMVEGGAIISGPSQLFHAAGDVASGIEQSVLNFSNHYLQLDFISSPPGSSSLEYDALLYITGDSMAWWNARDSISVEIGTSNGIEINEVPVVTEDQLESFAPSKLVDPDDDTSTVVEVTENGQSVTVTPKGDPEPAMTISAGGVVRLAKAQGDIPMFGQQGQQ
jgi:hypothetical protein